ncbi:unnamed protein product [Didymodactylos carnosus]|uniref:Uncharacterized protein n=1 Tax=Didymodactylos carnosus TaxID=1234261 RepID=A0A8S2I1B2_9BILA|nr:unnamed protein product [Didymodactylos carnosus]CAF3698894.1 unnamed protein product [Didymodactylos carnosus]
MLGKAIFTLISLIYDSLLSKKQSTQKQIHNNEREFKQQQIQNDEDALRNWLKQQEKLFENERQTLTDILIKPLTKDNDKNYFDLIKQWCDKKERLVSCPQTKVLNTDNIWAHFQNNYLLINRAITTYQQARRRKPQIIEKLLDKLQDYISYIKKQNSTLDDDKILYIQEVKQYYDSIKAFYETDNVDIKIILKKIDEWLNKQNEVSGQNLFIEQEVDDEYEHKSQKQEQQIINLCDTLNKLAQGSEFEKEFQQNDDEQQRLSPAVISGKIDNPSENDLPLIFRLNIDYNEWKLNGEDRQNEFCQIVCEQLQIPVNKLLILKVERGSTVLQVIVQPPYGKMVVEKLCSEDYVIHGVDNLYSIVIGRLNIKEQYMNSDWNRAYIDNRYDDDDDDDDDDNRTFWEGALDRGGKPYYCPKGWTRFGIKICETPEEFDQKWGDWYIAYHGTKSKVASDILNSGLRVSQGGCWTIRPCIYLSPSIEYCAHPRYAEPWSKPDEPNKFYQLVFQCRVNPRFITNKSVHPETLLSDDEKWRQIDENFLNSELEWVIPAAKGRQYITEDIICYGIMLRTFVFYYSIVECVTSLTKLHDMTMGQLFATKQRNAHFEDKIGKKNRADCGKVADQLVIQLTGKNDLNEVDQHGHDLRSEQDVELHIKKMKKIRGPFILRIALLAPASLKREDPSGPSHAYLVLSCDGIVGRLYQSYHDTLYLNIKYTVNEWIKDQKCRNEINIEQHLKTLVKLFVKMSKTTQKDVEERKDFFMESFTYSSSRFSPRILRTISEQIELPQQYMICIMYEKTDVGKMKARIKKFIKEADAKKQLTNAKSLSCY